jgi:hypothetical protein
MWIMLAMGTYWLYARLDGAIRGKWRIPDGKSESGPHDIRSFEGGSPCLCRLRTTSVGPPTTNIDYVLLHMGIWVPANLVASTVTKLDDTLPRFTDD